MNIENEYFRSVREVADYLSVSERVIRHLIKSGKIEATKISGQWRISNSSLSKYLQGRISIPE